MDKTYKTFKKIVFIHFFISLIMVYLLFIFSRKYPYTNFQHIFQEITILNTNLFFILLFILAIIGSFIEWLLLIVASPIFYYVFYLILECFNNERMCPDNPGLGAFLMLLTILPSIALLISSVIFLVKYLKSSNVRWKNLIGLILSLLPILLLILIFLMEYLE